MGGGVSVIPSPFASGPDGGGGGGLVDGGVEAVVSGLLGGTVGGGGGGGGGGAVVGGLAVVGAGARVAGGGGDVAGRVGSGLGSGAGVGAIVATGVGSGLGTGGRTAETGGAVSDVVIVGSPPADGLEPIVTVGRVDRGTVVFEGDLLGERSGVSGSDVVAGRLDVLGVGPSSGSSGATTVDAGSSLVVAPLSVMMSGTGTTASVMGLALVVLLVISVPAAAGTSVVVLEVSGGRIDVVTRSVDVVTRSVETQVVDDVVAVELAVRSSKPDRTISAIRPPTHASVTVTSAALSLLRRSSP